VLAALVGVLGAAVFGPAIGGPFIYDDNPLIGHNIYAHSFAWWPRWLTHDFWDINEEVRRFGRRMIYWRPGISASYALDWQLGHGSPMFFHVMNVVWHGAMSVLAFIVLRRWVGAAIPAALAALLFAVHPTKAESVAWIAGRTDVLCAVAMLLAANGCARRLRNEKGGLALEIAGTIAAYATKEQAVTLFAFVAVEVWVALGRPALDLAVLRRIARACIPQLAVAVVYLGIRTRYMPVQHEKAIMPLGSHVREVFETMGRFAELTFAPHDLSVQQALMQRIDRQVVFDNRYVAFGAFFVVAMLMAMWLLRARRPGISIGIGFYLLMLLPTSNVVLTDMATMLSERFLYLPLLGLALALGSELARLPGPPSRSFAVAASATAACIVALGVIAARRAADYDDDSHFWRRELALHPQSIEALRFEISEAGQQKNFDTALSLVAQAQQTALRHYQGMGLDLDFTIQGVQILLTKIPDHDSKSLRAIDRFLIAVHEGRDKSADLALGPVQISLPVDNPMIRTRIEAQRPLVLGLMASTKSRLVEDSAALDYAEQAQRDCPGCQQVTRVAALVAACAGDYPRARRYLDELARWTNEETVLETRTVLRTAETSGNAAKVATSEPQRLQLRATELATLEAWGRAYDVLAPFVEEIRKAPDFALGFAELAWRAGEFRTAREVLRDTMDSAAVAATTEQWSRKMGWIDDSGALGLTRDAGHGKEGR
jgi:hypothetical protein